MILTGQITATCILALVSAPGLPNSDPQEVATQIDELMHPLVDRDLTSGAVLIAQGDEITFARGFGLANRDHIVRNTESTRFRIASTSKALTAVAVMQLVEQGRIDIDAPLTTYIPDYPRGKDISIRHLLNHSSGILSTPFVEGYYQKSLSDHTLEQSITWFKDTPLQFDPGQKFDYSNSGYVLLSRIIEIVTGIDYEEYMEEHVFGPAGMIHSGLDSQNRIVKARATGYSRSSGGDVERADYRNPSECFGCGALFSTVGDLFRFQRAVVKAQLIGPETRDAMWDPVFDTPWGDQYGLGWFVGERFGHKLISARGGTTGFMSMVQYFPDTDILVVTLLNQDFMLHAELFQQLAAIALGEPWEHLLASSDPIEPDHPLLAFIGEYRMDDGVKVTISTDENGFFYKEEGQLQRFRAHPINDRSVYVAEPNARLRFEPATGDEPAKLIGLYGVLLWRGERVN